MICVLYNQSLSLSGLIDYIHGMLKGGDEVCVITSHSLFDMEIVRLIENAPEVRLYTVADFFTQADYDFVNTKHVESLTGVRDSLQKNGLYTYYQMQNLIYLMNEVLYQRILARWSESIRFYHCNGLGFSDSFWRQKKSTALCSDKYLSTKNFENTKSSSLYLVESKQESYVFISDISRLVFDRDVKITEIESGSFHKAITSRAKAEALAEIFADKQWPNISTLNLATTIHGYRNWMTEFWPNIKIFVDGYHPENYPRSYIDYYSRKSDVVTNDAVSARWFKNFGFRVSTSSMLINRTMALVPSNCSPKSVLFALNHAGDWCGGIHRSDTDLQIKAAIYLAKKYPTLSFTIRPHPTMAIAEHEGVFSKDRICKVIRNIGLSNLSASEMCLEDDLANNDIIISEYSQVLIDGWRLGKIGYIYNPTRRKSLMETFVRFGFLEANSISCLCKIFDQLLQNSQREIRLLNRAKSIYNQITKDYMLCQ